MASSFRKCRVLTVVIKGNGVIPVGVFNKNQINFFGRIFFLVTITTKGTIYVINLVYFFLLTDVCDEMNVQVAQTTLVGECCTRDKKEKYAFLPFL